MKRRYNTRRSLFANALHIENTFAYVRGEQLRAQNLFNKVYQSHLSRLKYADGPGIAAMGRNICVKVNIPLDFHL